MEIVEDLLRLTVSQELLQGVDEGRSGNLHKKKHRALKAPRTRPDALVLLAARRPRPSKVLSARGARRPRPSKVLLCAPEAVGGREAEREREAESTCVQGVIETHSCIPGTDVGRKKLPSCAQRAMHRGREGAPGAEGDRGRERGRGCEGETCRRQGSLAHSKATD